MKGGGVEGAGRAVRAKAQARRPEHEQARRFVAAVVTVVTVAAVAAVAVVAAVVAVAAVAAAGTWRSAFDRQSSTDWANITRPSGLVWYGGGVG